MINLIKNALKFTCEGSIEVQACYDEEEKSLVMHVKDTGAGIASEDMPKLFKKFCRLKRTAEINNDGIGLGLTIVKQIVEASGGSVSVYSEGLGHGSLFKFNMKMNSLDRTNANLTTVSIDQLTHAANELLSVRFNQSNRDSFGSEDIASNVSYHSQASSSILSRFQGLGSINRPINLLSPARLDAPQIITFET